MKSALLFMLSIICFFTTAHGQRESKLVDVGGYDLHVQVRTGAGIPILFESAAGEDGSLWDGIIDSIYNKTGTTLITYDRSGFGKSEINPHHQSDDQYGIMNGMVELETALQKLGYFEELILVCSSYGGLYSALFAARNPSIVKQVVMIDAGLTAWYTDRTVDKIVKNYPISREENEGHYFLLQNLKETVSIMRQSKFPDHIPVIDLVAGKRAYGWDDQEWDNWQTSHQKFTDASPLREKRLVQDAGHYIFNHKPDLVIDAIVEAFQKAQVVRPILLDQKALSGLGLQQIELKDQPGRAFFQKNLFRGEDLSVYVVSSQSWLGTMNNFPIDEYVFMFNGQARVQPEGGIDHVFHSGEHFFAPKGFTGEWEIIAGDHYHYELSLITTPRAESVLKSKGLTPFPFSKDQLSGLEIQLDAGGAYRELLVEGDELRIALHAEAPRKLEISEPTAEQFLHLLSGLIRITDASGEAHEFYTGDFFVLPKGCSGSWESEGHGIVKYLVMEKAF